jgi:hypothetical protein
MPAKSKAQTTFVFVKLPQEVLNRANRIPIPPSLKELKQSAANRLKLFDPIRSISNEDGSEITNIADVIPNSVLTVSTDRKPRTRIPQRPPSDDETLVDQSYDDMTLPEPVIPPPTAPITLHPDPPVEEAPDVPGELELLFRSALQESFNADLEFVLSKMPKQSGSLLQNAAGIEQEQEGFWYSNLCAHAKRNGLTADGEGIIYLDAMKAKADDLLRRHFFPGPAGYSILFRLVISGPPASGKTTFCGVLLQRLMLGLIGCGLWKRTCLIMIDGDEIAGAATDAKGLHLKIVDVTITALAAQVPSLTKHWPILQKYFERLVEKGPIPMLPKRFLEAPETQALGKACIEIAEELRSKWTNPDGGTEWAVLLFEFPLLLAKIVGFEDVILLIDHFDSMNLILPRDVQFRSGDIHLTECVKMVLNKAQYILSYHSETRFENCLVPLDDLLTGFELELDYFSTLDLECEPEYKDHAVIVVCGRQSFTLTAAHFGGIPGYLKHWNVLNGLLGDMELVRKYDEAAEDFLSQVITHAGKVLPLVFQSERPFAEIDDVRRRKA